MLPDLERVERIGELKDASADELVPEGEPRGVHSCRSVSAG